MRAIPDLVLQKNHPDMIALYNLLREVNELTERNLIVAYEAFSKAQFYNVTQLRQAVALLQETATPFKRNMHFLIAAENSMAFATALNLLHKQRILKNANVRMVAKANDPIKTAELLVGLEQALLLIEGNSSKIEKLLVTEPLCNNDHFINLLLDLLNRYLLTEDLFNNIMSKPADIAELLLRLEQGQLPLPTTKDQGLAYALTRENQGDEITSESASEILTKLAERHTISSNLIKLCEYLISRNMLTKQNVWHVEHLFLRNRNNIEKVIEASEHIISNASNCSFNTYRFIAPYLLAIDNPMDLASAIVELSSTPRLLEDQWVAIVASKADPLKTAQLLIKLEEQSFLNEKNPSPIKRILTSKLPNNNYVLELLSNLLNAGLLDETLINHLAHNLNVTGGILDCFGTFLLSKFDLKSIVIILKDENPTDFARNLQKCYEEEFFTLQEIEGIIQGSDPKQVFKEKIESHQAAANLLASQQKPVASAPQHYQAADEPPHDPLAIAKKILEKANLATPENVRMIYQHASARDLANALVELHSTQSVQSLIDEDRAVDPHNDSQLALRDALSPKNFARDIEIAQRNKEAREEGNKTSASEVMRAVPQLANWVGRLTEHPLPLHLAYALQSLHTSNKLNEATIRKYREIYNPASFIAAIKYLKKYNITLPAGDTYEEVVVEPSACQTNQVARRFANGSSSNSAQPSTPENPPITLTDTEMACIKKSKKPLRYVEALLTIKLSKNEFVGRVLATPIFQSNNPHRIINVMIHICNELYVGSSDDEKWQILYDHILPLVANHLKPKTLLAILKLILPHFKGEEAKDLTLQAIRHPVPKTLLRILELLVEFNALTVSTANQVMSHSDLSTLIKYLPEFIVRMNANLQHYSESISHVEIISSLISHPNPSSFVQAIQELDNCELLKDINNFQALVNTLYPNQIAYGLELLAKAEFLTAESREATKNARQPEQMAEKLRALYAIERLKRLPNYQHLLQRHSKPSSLLFGLVLLSEANLLTPERIEQITQHENPHDFIMALFKIETNYFDSAVRLLLTKLVQMHAYPDSFLEGIEILIKMFSLRCNPQRLLQAIDSSISISEDFSLLETYYSPMPHDYMPQQFLANATETEVSLWQSSASSSQALAIASVVTSNPITHRDEINPSSVTWLEATLKRIFHTADPQRLANNFQRLKEKSILTEETMDLVCQTNNYPSYIVDMLITLQDAGILNQYYIDLAIKSSYPQAFATIITSLLKARVLEKGDAAKVSERGYNLTHLAETISFVANYNNSREVLEEQERFKNHPPSSEEYQQAHNARVKRGPLQETHLTQTLKEHILNHHSPLDFISAFHTLNHEGLFHSDYQEVVEQFVFPHRNPNIMARAVGVLKFIGFLTPNTDCATNEHLRGLWTHVQPHYLALAWGYLWKAQYNAPANVLDILQLHATPHELVKAILVLPIEQRNEPLYLEKLQWHRAPEKLAAALKKFSNVELAKCCLDLITQHPNDPEVMADALLKLDDGDLLSNDINGKRLLQSGLIDFYEEWKSIPNKFLNKTFESLISAAKQKNPREEIQQIASSFSKSRNLQDTFFSSASTSQPSSNALTPP